MKPTLAFSALLGLLSAAAGAVDVDLANAQCFVDDRTTIYCEDVRVENDFYWMKLTWSNKRKAFVPYRYSETEPTTQMRLYAAPGRHTGNLAGSAADPRMAVDELCASNQPARYQNSIAFISLHQNDPIVKFPFTHGVPRYVPIVAGAYDTKIADDWEDLMDGQIDFSLSDLGVTKDGWWSGSSSRGLWNYDSCSFWTSDDAYDQGHYGSPGATNEGWIDYSNNNCNAELTVLCLAY